MRALESPLLKKLLVFLVLLATALPLSATQNVCVVHGERIASSEECGVDYCSPEKSWCPAQAHSSSAFRSIDCRCETHITVFHSVKAAANRATLPPFPAVLKSDVPDLVRLASLPEALAFVAETHDPPTGVLATHRSRAPPFV